MKRARTIAELEKLIGQYVPDPKQTIRDVDKTLFKIGKQLINNIKIAHEWKDRSRLLTRSHYVKKLAELEIVIGNNAKSRDGAPYGLFLHEGTGIYGANKRPIKPTRAQFLQFKLPSGQWIRTKSVKGVKALKWLPKEWDRERPKSVRQIQDTILKQARI